MKNSTLTNASQFLVTLPATGLSGAPVVLSLTPGGNRIIQINNDIAVTPNYVFMRLTQKGRLIFPVAAITGITPLNSGWYMLKSAFQLFVDIPIDSDTPIQLEAFCTAATAPIAITLITAGESAESLLLKVLDQLETLNHALIRSSPPA